MPRRKSKYPDKPYTVSEDARRRFAALMALRRREKVKVIDNWIPRGGWQLWRWNNQEDVTQP